MQEATSETFGDMIKDKTLIKFGATWCGPCKVQDNILEIFSKDDNGVKVASVDIDTNPTLASKYGIQSVPTILAFDNGTEIKRLVGVQPISILKNIFM